MATPRRSARLAAKTTKANMPVVRGVGKAVDNAIKAVAKSHSHLVIIKDDTTTSPHMTINEETSPATAAIAATRILPTNMLSKEESRKQFLEAADEPMNIPYTTKCVAMIRQYLNDVEMLCSRTAKASISICLNNYLVQNPKFLAHHERFRKTVLDKMKEFETEQPIQDAIVDAEFRQSIADVLFVIQ
jgi:hypothetical protein